MCESNKIKGVTDMRLYEVVADLCYVNEKWVKNLEAGIGLVAWRMGM